MVLLWLSLLNRLACVPTHQRGLRASVPAYQQQRGLCANVSACQRAESMPTVDFYVSTCQQTSQRKKRHAIVSICCAKGPKSVKICQRFPYKTISYISILYCYTKDSSLSWYQGYTYLIYIYIVHRNCSILHFNTLCHIKEKRVGFLFFLFFFYAL